MSRASAARALLAGVLAVLAAGAAGAHTRSQSFSTWEVHGGDVIVVFSAPAYEATRLAALEGEADDLDALLRAHLARTLAVVRGAEACTPQDAARSLAARAGTLRVEARFRCPEQGALHIHVGAFFDAAPSHVHYARVRIDGGLAVEQLFSDAQRERTVATAGSASPEGASFASYVALGIGHIAGGADHVAFLLVLLLACRRPRDVAILASGFTLGHSLTLALAVLGVVRPNVPVVEALIGFSIALVAAQNVAVRARAERGLALAAGAGLAALALLHIGAGIGLPARASLGLALFSVCYLPLAGSQDTAARLRPLLTLLFGLVHGFGFAGVLLEVGLPAGRLASALVGFNLGVELGQLALVTLLWSAGRALRHRLAWPHDPRFAAEALSAALLALGVFWFVARSLAR